MNLSFLVHLVDSYGYLLVGGIIFLESMGLFLPGETALLLASAYAAQGRLSIGGVILAAALGAVLGDNAGYWIGRSGGKRVLLKLSGSRGEQRLQKGRAFFERYGPRAVFLARFVPFLRVLSAELAGMGEMNYLKFTLYNACGGVAWAMLMGSLGYLFGRNLNVLLGIVQRLGIGLVLAIGMVAVIAWTGRQLADNQSKLQHAWGRLRTWLHLDDLQAWMGSRTHSEQRIAMTMLAGLLAALLAGWAFGALAEDVVNQEFVSHYDAGVGQWLLNHATDDSTQFFYAMSLLGGPPTIAGGVILAAVLLMRRRLRLATGLLLAAVGGGGLLDWILKQIFMRPRPDFPNAFYHESGYSFPSGHAMISVLFYGCLAYILARLIGKWKWRVALAMAGLALALLIGFSRLYLGVHYLTDVLAGWAAGAAWLGVCVLVSEVVERRYGFH